MQQAKKKTIAYKSFALCLREQMRYDLKTPSTYIRNYFNVIESWEAGRGIGGEEPQLNYSARAVTRIHTWKCSRWCQFDIKTLN